MPQGRSAETKLKEIIYIKEGGQARQKDRAGAAGLRRAKVGYSEEDIVQKYWEELENECRVSAGALQKIRSNRLDLLIRESAEGEEEAKDFQNLSHQLLEKLPRVTHSQTLHCSPDASPPRQDALR